MLFCRCSRNCCCAKVWGRAEWWGCYQFFLLLGEFLPAGVVQGEISVALPHRLGLPRKGNTCSQGSTKHGVKYSASRLNRGA